MGPLKKNPAGHKCAGRKTSHHPDVNAKGDNWCSRHRSGESRAGGLGVIGRVELAQQRTGHAGRVSIQL